VNGGLGFYPQEKQPSLILMRNLQVYPITQDEIRKELKDILKEYWKYNWNTDACIDMRPAILEEVLEQLEQYWDFRNL
jgi:hypothetical protein